MRGRLPCFFSKTAPLSYHEASSPHGVTCPLCESINTRLKNAFGSAPCRSLFQCDDCGNPFEHFKTH
jgi:transposase-like protein